MLIQEFFIKKQKKTYMDKIVTLHAFRIANRFFGKRS